MAEGFRYTESGDLRVTEDSDFRVTEGAILGEAGLFGNGSTLFAGLGEFRGVFEVSGAGTASFTATLDAVGEVVSSSATYDRITEVGDTRVTEGGDIRITDDVLINTGRGTIEVAPTYTPFTSSMYINIDGAWDMSVPYVKYGGEWQEPIAIYKNVSGIWKRVH